MSASDSELLASAAAGDADAFAELYRRHLGAVTGLAVRLGTTADEVADIVSESFIVALARAGRYIGLSDSARPWLLGITWRVAHRGFRRRARQLLLIRKLRGSMPRFVGDEAEAVAAAVDAARASSALETARRRLPRGERRLVQLVVDAGLTPTEAAAVLGISPNAARLRLARARRRLRAEAGNDSNDNVAFVTGAQEASP